MRFYIDEDVKVKIAEPGESDNWQAGVIKSIYVTFNTNIYLIQLTANKKFIAAEESNIKEA